MLKDMLSDFQITSSALCFKINHRPFGLQHQALQCLTDGATEGRADSTRCQSRAELQSGACSHI